MQSNSKYFFCCSISHSTAILLLTLEHFLFLFLFCVSTFAFSLWPLEPHLYVDLNHACSVCGCWLVKCCCFLFVVLRLCYNFVFGFLLHASCFVIFFLITLVEAVISCPKVALHGWYPGCQKAFMPPGSSVARADARNCRVVGMPAADVAILLIEQGHSSG